MQVAMITGGNSRTAEAIAAQVGIERVLAEVLPGTRGTRSEVCRTPMRWWPPLAAVGCSGAIIVVRNSLRDAPIQPMTGVRYRGPRCRTARYRGSRMRKTVLIVVVVALVLLGLPMPVAGMGAIDCGDCDRALAGNMNCVAAVLSALFFLAVVLRPGNLTVDRRQLVRLLLASRLERPPRLV